MHSLRATNQIDLEGVISENIGSTLATDSANINMSVKQTLLESFFIGGGKKRPSDGDNAETAADEKKGKKKAAFNCKYDDSFLKTEGS